MQVLPGMVSTTRMEATPKRSAPSLFKVQNGTARVHRHQAQSHNTCNDRAGIGVHHFDFNFELGQFFFDGNAVFQQLFFSLRGA